MAEPRITVTRHRDIVRDALSLTPTGRRLGLQVPPDGVYGVFRRCGHGRVRAALCTALWHWRTRREGNHNSRG